MDKLEEGTKIFFEGKFERDEKGVPDREYKYESVPYTSVIVLIGNDILLIYQKRRFQATHYFLPDCLVNILFCVSISSYHSFLQLFFDMDLFSPFFYL